MNEISKKLAYVAITKELEREAASVSTIRNQSVAILSATMLIATLAANGFDVFKPCPIKGESALPGWMPFAMVLLLFIASALCAWVLSPISEFCVGPSARAIMQSGKEHPKPITKKMIENLIRNSSINKRKLNQRMVAVKLQVLILLFEIALIIGTVEWRSK